MRDGVEHAEKRGDEVLLRQVLDQLVVDLGEDRVEIRAEPQRDAQHAGHLRGAERRADAVAARIAEQQEQSMLVERHEVEGVAAGLVGRAELAGHVVLRQPRHLRRQRAHLDLARQLDLAVELFGRRQGTRHALALDEDDALRRERLGDALVLGRKRAVLAVDDLQHAHELRALDERHGQHAADVVVDVQVDRRIEQRLELAVGNVDDLARTRRQAEDALRETGADWRDARRAAGEDQHALVRLEQPDGGALATQHAARCLADFGQHLSQFERRSELARHLEDLQQGFRT